MIIYLFLNEYKDTLQANIFINTMIKYYGNTFLEEVDSFIALLVGKQFLRIIIIVINIDFPLLFIFMW